LRTLVLDHIELPPPLRFLTEVVGWRSLQ
jgi:hypothetical protein